MTCEGCSSCFVGVVKSAPPPRSSPCEGCARGHSRSLQIHKPSARVSFGLPDPLSFQVRSHVMVARRSGTNLDRESVRVRLPSSLTRRLGNAMRASQKSKRNKAKANRTLAYVSSTLSMATHNLVNMVAITVVSGTVLLALLAARHF